MLRLFGQDVLYTQVQTCKLIKDTALNLRHCHAQPTRLLDRVWCQLDTLSFIPDLLERVGVSDTDLRVLGEANPARESLRTRDGT